MRKIILVLKGHRPGRAVLSGIAQEKIIDIYSWKAKKVAETELTVPFRLLFYIFIY